MSAKDWVSNDTDMLVARAQEDLAAGRKVDSRLMSKLMDLISGVDGYSPSDMRRQGVIAKFFSKEITKTSGVLNSANYMVGMEDLVSVFWENVMQTLPTARQQGTVVKVRQAAGAEVTRPTSSNSVYYIRSQSITKTRNYINAIYSKMLVQSCDDCFNHGPPNKEEVDVQCGTCGSDVTEPVWPDGNTKYRAKKARRCLSCLTTWKRKFEYRCSRCKSDNISIGPKTVSKQESVYDESSIARSSEDEALDAELEREIDHIYTTIRASLPKNPADRLATSKTMELFDMLVDKSKSVDMCAKCRLSAPTICVKRCTVPCKHDTMLDPRSSCGETEFTVASCVNYSKKIGEYVGCSASLVARRMKQIRATTVECLGAMSAESELAASTLQALHIKGLLDE